MREKLIELLEDVGASCDIPIDVDEDGCGTYEIEGADYIADHLIANGVTVQQKGKWIDDSASDITVCSECKSEWNIFDNDTYRFKYCPYCGADMRGAE